MQLEPPLEPGRSYFVHWGHAMARIRITRIRLLGDRWFAIGLDLDQQQRRGFYVDAVNVLEVVIRPRSPVAVAG